MSITDRKKDIIVTAGGKNVAPQNLENSLKTFPLVSQAMVHGDKRKYLSVLIAVNEEAAQKLLTDGGIAPPCRLRRGGQSAGDRRRGAEGDRRP